MPQPRQILKRFPLTCILLSLGFASGGGLIAESVDGNATIRAAAEESEIVIRTTSRLAGAIDSLTWKDKEFIDSCDHGRQLQSASNLDCGTPLTPETYNPTEAGSRQDGCGGASSSKLLEIHATQNELTTFSKMAFWLAPGEKSGPNPAKNTTVLSNHGLKKKVRIGYEGLPNVISYDVTFSLPLDERHTQAVFEALTGYMPPEFSEFLKFNPATGNLDPLDDGPGETPFPIVFTVPGGTHAMGIYAPPQPGAATSGPTFGRFRFIAEKVVKWNCVFRVTEPGGITGSQYSFRMFVIVGSLDAVWKSMRALSRKLENSQPLA